MNGYHIINLSPHSLAKATAGKESLSFEEKLKGDASGVFDAQSQQNLILKCVDCGDLHQADASTLGECDACGGSRFHVSRLVERSQRSLNDFDFQITGTMPRQFLHIKSSHAKEYGAQIYYTTNGANPSESSILYKHPIPIEPSWLGVKAVAIAPTFYSQVIDLPLKSHTSTQSTSTPPSKNKATAASEILPPSSPPPLPPRPHPVPPSRPISGGGCCLQSIVVFVFKWIFMNPIFYYFLYKAGFFQ